MVWSTSPRYSPRSVSAALTATLATKRGRASNRRGTSPHNLPSSSRMLSSGRSCLRPTSKSTGSWPGVTFTAPGKSELMIEMRLLIYSQILLRNDLQQHGCLYHEWWQSLWNGTSSNFSTSFSSFDVASINTFLTFYHQKIFLHVLVSICRAKEKTLKQYSALYPQRQNEIANGTVKRLNNYTIP